MRKYVVLLLALLALSVAPAGSALVATGGHYGPGPYGEIVFFPAGDPGDPCAAKGSETVSVDPEPTTGIDPVTWRWFQKWTHHCANGETAYRVELGDPAPPMPGEEESSYQPDVEPAAGDPPCQDGYYGFRLDGEFDWIEGNC